VRTQFLRHAAIGECTRCAQRTGTRDAEAIGMLAALRVFGGALTAMVVVGCADHAMWRSEYDDVARITAAQLATPDRGGEVGALADCVTIAQGALPKGFNYDTSGLVTGTHAGIAERFVPSVHIT
jgi:hypothetical protein